MAKDDCLILFSEVEHTMRKLTDEQFGILIRAVLAYRFRGEVYSGKDIRVDQAFETLANQVDREETKRQKKVKAAEVRWEKASQECKPMQADANDANDAPIPSNPIHSHPVQSDPIPSKKNSHNSKTSAMGKGVQGAAAPAPTGKQRFGKFGWIQLSLQEYHALAAQLGEEELKRCITYLDESAQSTGNKNRWKDFGLVIRRCSQEGWGLARPRPSARDIPMGATGVLGEAELRNIQRAMKGGDGNAGTS